MDNLKNWAIVIAVVALVQVAWLAGCVTDDSEARETLEAAGFSEIQITGVDFFRCGEGDKSGAKFLAKNPAGRRVSGTVCCGVMKGCTVRF